MKLINGFSTSSNNRCFDAKVYDFPFRHLIIDNLFDSESLSSLEEGFYKSKNDLPPDLDIFDTYERNHVEITDERVLWSFYGKQFTEVIGSLIDSKLCSCSNIGPDFRFYKGGFEGVAPHTDFEKNKEKLFVGLFYFGNQDIESEGCLKLWQLGAESSLYEIKSISPRNNRFVLFEVTEKSWHSVSAVHSSIFRNNLYIPYTERASI
jgi:hypothetical protein